MLVLESVSLGPGAHGVTLDRDLAPSELGFLFCEFHVGSASLGMKQDEERQVTCREGQRGGPNCVLVTQILEAQTGNSATTLLTRFCLFCEIVTFHKTRFHFNIK